MTSYDREVIAAFFDAYTEQEWERLERLERTPTDRVNFEVHKRFLEENVRGPGAWPLDGTPRGTA